MIKLSIVIVSSDGGENSKVKSKLTDLVEATRSRRETKSAPDILASSFTVRVKWSVCSQYFDPKYNRSVRETIELFNLSEGIFELARSVQDTNNGDNRPTKTQKK